MAEITILDNPFPGLRSFDVENASMFFGRADTVRELEEKLRSNRFVTVLGNAGVGKSSVVRAGLLPALVSDISTQTDSRYSILIMRPGIDPIGNLARAIGDMREDGPDLPNVDVGLRYTKIESTLRSSERGLVNALRPTENSATANYLLFIDQFEELFWQYQDERTKDKQADRSHFIRLLIDASTQENVELNIITTMRTDFLAECSVIAGLSSVINPGMHLLSPLRSEEYRLAITGPLEVSQTKITSGLVTELLENIDGQYDDGHYDILPLFQQALHCTWNNWSHSSSPDQPLDLMHYHAIGGITECVSQPIERAFQELPDQQHKLLTEHIFKRFARVGPNVRLLPTVATVAELCGSAQASVQEIADVMDRLSNGDYPYFNIRDGGSLRADSLVELVHETIVDCWPRAREWTAEEAHAVNIYLRLCEKSADHERNQAGLLTNPELRDCLDWERNSQPHEGWAIRYDSTFQQAMQYLQASAENEETPRQEAEPLVWRKRTPVKIAAVALGLAFVVWGSVNLSRQDSSELQTEASVAMPELNYVKSTSDRAEVGKGQPDNVEALVSDVEARQRATEEKLQMIMARLSDLQSTAEKRKAAIEEQKQEQQRIAGEQQRMKALKDQIEQEKADMEKAVKQLDMRLMARKLSLKVQSVRNDTIEQLLALLAFDLHVESGGEPMNPVVYNGLQTALDEQAILQDRDGNSMHLQAVRMVRFSEDGKVIASASDDGILNFWRASTFSEDALRAQYDQNILTFAKHPSEALFNISVWKIAEHFVDQGQRIRRLSFCPDLDDGSLFVGTESGQLSSWRLMRSDLTQSGLTEQVILPTRKSKTDAISNNGVITGMAFGRGGQLVAVGALNGLVKVGQWPLAQRDPFITEWTAISGYLRDMTFVGNKGHVLCAVGEVEGKGILQVWDWRSIKEGAISQYHAPESLTKTATSADGRFLAVGSSNGDILVWELPDGVSDINTLRPKSLYGHNSRITDLAFYSDENLLVSASLDQTVRLWDPSKADLDPVVIDHPSWIWSVDVSPDGGTIAAGTNDGEVYLWTANTELLADRLRARVERNLTQLEWKEYVGTLKYREIIKD